jgi:hypothetical protein
VTPYEGSLEVRKLCLHSSLIALPRGTARANSLDGDACLDDQLADYLATGKLPPRQHGPTRRHHMRAAAGAGAGHRGDERGQGREGVSQ